MPTTADLVNELAGTRCRCGRNKRPKQSFCSLCYFALPKWLQSDLYRTIGNGYEQAYQQAAAFVDERSKSAPAV